MTSMQQNEKQHSESPDTTQAFIVGFWGVRYQVKDVQRAITFYTQTLGFNLDMQNLPAFGQVSIGGLKLILSGPGASGSRPMPDGRMSLHYVSNAQTPAACGRQPSPAESPI
jgi:catechol 2,3-dioxygenase-like lactoylglutathione lyase family enzyme